MDAAELTKLKTRLTEQAARIALLEQAVENQDDFAAGCLAGFLQVAKLLQSLGAGAAGSLVMEILADGNRVRQMPSDATPPAWAAMILQNSGAEADYQERRKALQEIRRLSAERAAAKERRERAKLSMPGGAGVGVCNKGAGVQFPPASNTPSI